MVMRYVWADSLTNRNFAYYRSKKTTEARFTEVEKNLQEEQKSYVKKSINVTSLKRHFNTPRFQENPKLGTGKTWI